MIRILIADDLLPLCKRYKNYINKTSGMETTGIANSGTDAVKLACQLRPDIVLMDIEMETRTAGLEASEQILNALPDTKIIILTVYEDDEFVFNAFQLGVCDYILKNASREEIISCIQDAYAGSSPIRPVIAEKIRRPLLRGCRRRQSFFFFLLVHTPLLS